MFSPHAVDRLECNGSDIDSEDDGSIIGADGYFYDDAVPEQQRIPPVEATIQGFMDELKNKPQETMKNVQNSPHHIFDRFPRLDSQSETDGRTVLHHIVDEYVRLNPRAEDIKIQRTAMILATQNITQKYPYLLKVAANSTTPLYRAIVNFATRQDDSLIRSMIWHCKRPVDTQDTQGVSQSRGDDNAEVADLDGAAQSKRKHPLTEALEVRCEHVNGGVQRSENVLHLALRSPTVFAPRIKALVRLAKQSSEESVLARDADGFTPVHYAASYAWSSSKTQEEIIQYLLAVGDSQALVEDGNGVLDILTNSGLSIYQYHLKTRRHYRTQNEPKPGSTALDSHARGRLSSNIRLGTEGVDSAYDAIRSTTGRDVKGATSAQSRDLEQNSRGVGRDVRLPEERSRDDRHNTRYGEREVYSSKETTATPRDARESANIGRASGASALTSQWETNERYGRSLDTSRPSEAQSIHDPPPGIRRAATGGQRAGDKATSRAKAVPEATDEDYNRLRDKVSGDLQMLLKVRCLRTRSHDKSARFLYGSNPKHIQTWFDYQEVAEEIDMDVFIETFQDVTFDSVLKYVALPSVRVRKWNQSKDNALRQTDQRGRSDTLFFFNWLRKYKGVKHILKVVIQDSSQDPHSDEAIEICLRGLGVEFLDWSKRDLDPDTIYNAAPDLTHVVLRWSGNNAVLRAWGEHEGLRRLPYLKVVYLLADQINMFESQQRVKTQVEKFKRRLKEACPNYVRKYLNEQYERDMADKDKNKTVNDVTGDDDTPEASTKLAEAPSWLASPQITHPVECFYGLDAYGSRQFQAPLPTAISNGDPSTLTTPPHRWLDATDDFAYRIRNIWTTIVEEMESKVSGTSIPANTSVPISTTMGTNQRPQEVVVALIDDGVDTMAQQLSGKILTGRTFASALEGDRNLPWYVSERGHGTVMASMITRVCPMAKIYPIRLDTGTRLTSGGGAMIKPDSAPEAIRAAVDRGASIISMSWTVTEPPHELKIEFEGALQYALDKNVLLLCSSSDLGHGNNSKRYPAAYREKSFIKIGAAQPSGLPYDWVGDLSNVDFILPGVEVVNRHPHRGPGHVKSLTTETGSSVATALGAGLAALIIYCARVNQMYGSSKLNDEDISKLLKAENMVKAMSSFGLSASKGTENKFIEVWNKLEGATKRLTTARGAKAREIVAELARDLISPSTLR